MDIFREGCMDMFRGEIYGYVQRMDIWICTEEGYMDMYTEGYMDMQGSDTWI